MAFSIKVWWIFQEITNTIKSEGATMIKKIWVLSIASIVKIFIICDRGFASPGVLFWYNALQLCQALVQWQNKLFISLVKQFFGLDFFSFLILCLVEKNSFFIFLILGMTEFIIVYKVVQLPQNDIQLCFMEL